MKRLIVSKTLAAFLSGIMLVGNYPVTALDAPNAQTLVSSGRIQNNANVKEQEETAASAVKCGDVNGDGTIDGKDAEAILSVKLEKCPQADVNADGVLNETDADMIKSYTAGQITYFPVGTEYQADTEFVTRGEWIHALTEGFKMQVDDPSSVVEYYTDLTDYEYAADINLAANYGVFDVLGEAFHPDVYVTREFAAHTLNYCLGYPSDVQIVITDAESVYYDGDAQVAVNKGWFQTVDGAFCSSMYVTLTEAQTMYDTINAAVATLEIDEKHDDTVIYDGSVIEVKDAEKVTLSGNTVTFIDTEASLNAGDTIAFELEGILLVRKVLSVSEAVESDSEIRILTVETEIAEDSLVSDVDAEGYAYIDYDAIEILTEGVEVQVEKPAAALPGRASGGHTYNYGRNLSLSGDIPLGNLKLTLSGTLSNISVTYSYNMSLVSLNQFYLGMNANASITGTLSGALPSNKSGAVDLFQVPVVGAGDFEAYIKVSAKAELSGKISLSYTCSVNAGISYTKNDGWRLVKNFTGGKLVVDAEAHEKLTLIETLGVKLFGKDLGKVYASVGEVGDFVAHGETGSMLCSNLNGYLFAEVGAMIDPPFLSKFEKTWTVFDKNNTPLRFNIHWENGKKVDKCTQGFNEATVNNAVGGGSCGGGAGGGYVSGSGYGSGYVGGVHAAGWYSKFYSATMAFKDMEPALVISEDRVLTDDLEVETDIVILAKLDLNGHKLTAKKNVTLGENDEAFESSVAFNKGSMIVEGNLYTYPYAKIIMQNREDLLRVDGEARFDYLDGTLTAGTAEFNGDIFGEELSTSEMFNLVLTGDKDQHISAPVYAEVLEIKNSDTRKLYIDNRLYVEAATTVDGEKIQLVCNDSKNGASDVTVGKINADKILIDGDLTFGGLDFTGSEITVNGNIKVTGDLILKKAKVTVNGDYDSMEGNPRLELNGSNITVSGDFLQRGNILMTNKNDKLTIGGDATFEGLGSEILDGIIDVKCDLRVIDGDWLFGQQSHMSTNNKLILSGEEDITLYIQEFPTFATIEFQNSDKRTMYMDGNLVAEAIDCGEKPLNIVTKGGSFEIGTITCSEMNIKGDCSVIHPPKFLNCKALNFDGDVHYEHNVFGYGEELNKEGMTMTVKGTLSANGDVTTGGSVITVEDLEFSDGNLIIGKGTLNVTGDMKLSGGNIVMEADKGCLDITGDLDIPRNEGYDSIRAGSIKCGGDINCTGNSHLCMSGSSAFVLTSKEDQTVKNESLILGDDIYFFTNLNVLNAADRIIILKGALNTKEISADSEKVSIKTDSFKLANAKLNCDLDISGDLTFTVDTFDLNGHTVNVNGNLNHTAGMVKINTGTLNITKDYRIVRDADSAVYTVSTGILNMTQKEDTVSVGGDFITMTSEDHTDYLTAGTLEIKGDFYQYADGTSFAFPASGTHTVVLSGSDVQTITFESYDDSHFNFVDMKQDPINYKFSDDPCWNALAGEVLVGETKLGDVNGDESIDLKDVVVMRRALAGWDVELNEANGDVNKDGSFDLKDVVVLRRFLAGWDVAIA